MIVLYILLAIFIFGFLIFIHELGHFLVARACGVKILEFAIGMGPRILSHRSKKSGTVYALRVLPIGGLPEKSMAAFRNGIRTILIPKDNLSDLDEVDELIKSSVTFVPVDCVSQVLENALVKPEPEKAFDPLHEKAVAAPGVPLSL